MFIQPTIQISEEDYQAMRRIVWRALRAVNRTRLNPVEDADDIASLVILIVLQRYGPSALTSWGLIKVISRRYVYRRAKAEDLLPKRQPLPSDLLDGRRLPDPDAVRQFLAEAGPRLTPALRRIVTIAVKYGLDMDAEKDRKRLASILGIDRHALRQHIHKIRTRCGDLWGEYLALLLGK